MTEYTVIWEVQVLAADPKAAAQTAAAMVNKSFCCVYDVFDEDGEKTRIDLEGDEGVVCHYCGKAIPEGESYHTYPEIECGACREKED
jgi:DNA-directed RNA polymerase subunit RPC12/RpoP